MRILIALLLPLFIAASAVAGEFNWAINDSPGFSWAVTEKGGDPQQSAAVNHADFIHKITVGNNVGTCVCVGDGLYLTVKHLWDGVTAGYRMTIADAQKSGVIYYLPAKVQGDPTDLAVVRITRPFADHKAAEICLDPLKFRQPVAFYSRVAGELQSGEVIYDGQTRFGLGMVAVGDDDPGSEKGDSGSGVFDADGRLVGINSSRASNGEFTEARIISFTSLPLASEWVSEQVFGEKVVSASSASVGNAQSEWLDGFTGIYLATAPWCGHCPAAKLQIPALEKLGWTVVEKNTDRERAFAAAFNIQSLPTWIVVQDGQVTIRAVGSGIPTTEKPEPAEREPEQPTVVVSTLPAEAGPTPYAEVSRILGILKLQADDVYADIGCGADARWCVAAAETTDCRRIIGIEIDPQRAASARAHVESLGLSGRIEIIEGDALEVDLSDVTVATVYLYADMLEKLRPKLTGMDRFASYMHQVPGLSMFKHGDAFVWNSADHAQPAPAATSRPYAVWGNQAYYGRVCSNPNCQMCNSIQQQLSGR
jgi:thiol-disulfide isomerase/thioredoxin